jgi:hypothetical protein
MTYRGGRRQLLGTALALLLPSALTAQGPPAQALPGPSHRLLDGAADLPASPEDAMAQRLEQIRDAQRIQHLIGRLKRDDAFKQRLLNQFSPDELNRLQEALKSGQGLSNNPQLREWFRKLQGSGGVKQDDIDAIKRLVQKQEAAQGANPAQVPGANAPGGGSGQGGGPQQPGSQAPGMPQTPGGPASGQQSPPKSWWDRMRDKVADWSGARANEFPDHMADWLDKLGDGTAGEALREGLRTMGRGGDNTWPLQLDERAGELFAKLSEMAANLPADNGSPWPDWRSALSDVRARLPEMDEPGPGVGAAGDAGVRLLPLLTCLAAVAVGVYLLWRVAERRQAGSGQEWRPGPWPVAPGAVATRGDLVKAFEHLALLCLGPAARTCNHLELADRLGSDDEPRRRYAARELATLYERARYAPDDEPLAAEDLAAARHDLSLLAGVAAS